MRSKARTTACTQGSSLALLVGMVAGISNPALLVTALMGDRRHFGNANEGRRCERNTKDREPFSVSTPVSARAQ